MDFKPLFGANKPVLKAQKKNLQNLQVPYVYFLVFNFFHISFLSLLICLDNKLPYLQLKIVLKVKYGRI